MEMVNAAERPYKYSSAATDTGLVPGELWKRACHSLRTETMASQVDAPFATEPFHRSNYPSGVVRTLLGCFEILHRTRVFDFSISALHLFQLLLSSPYPINRLIGHDFKFTVEEESSFSTQMFVTIRKIRNNGG